MALVSSTSCVVSKWRRDRYDTLLVLRDGTSRVFRSHA